MSNPWLQLGAGLAALVFLALVTFEGRGVGQQMGWIAEEEPVFVFTSPHEGSFELVKAAIDPGRVVVGASDGIALEGGRLYVRDVAVAGDLIETAGWVSRPIQIVTLGMLDEAGAEAAGRATSGMSREERLARLRQLVHKPTLTRGEQIFVLQAMNDGIEI